MKLSLVIPTLNRINELKSLVASIHAQVIPKGLNVTICISGAYCNSKVKAYLKSIEGRKRRFNFKIHVQPIGSSNWYLASCLVPSDCDFAWTLGDDDEFTDSRSISRIFHFLKLHPDIDGLFIPMASRVKNEYYIKDKFYDVCNRVGFHEVAGWISSSIIRSKVFKEIYQNVCDVHSAKKIAFYNTPKLAQTCYEQKIGQFTHATCILEALFDSPVIYASFNIIREQTSPRGLFETLKRDKISIKNKKYHGTRFIFDLIKISQILIKNSRTPSPIFYRYVCRDYFQLCYDILLDGILTNSYSSVEVVNLLEIMSMAIISDDISYIKCNKITILFIESLYSAKAFGERDFKRSQFQRLFELVRVKEYINS